MLNSEYKVLKYINKHEGVSFKTLLHKYKTFNSTLPCISSYLRIEDKKQMFDENDDPNGEYETVLESKFYTTHQAKEYIESKSMHFWSFFFPYAITTALAIASILLQLS